MKIHLLPFCFILATLLSGCFPKNANTSLDDKIENILSTMTLEQKIGQLSLRGTSSRGKGLSEELKNDVRAGKVSAILNLTDTSLVMELQKIAVNESPQHIPLLFGRDVIHGYKTTFPIPLALASSWDTSLARKSAQIAAHEAYSRCINWTFAPMVDICRDARWGRIAETSGEDPYLASMFASAYVKGFQGTSLNKPGNILACVKHFAAYGAAEGGRDYNTVNMSESLLRDIYLKPYHAAIQADVATVMTSFNDLNGVPASGNAFLLKHILRKEWNFNGFVVSDWNSITEMIAHGYCDNEKDAALKAATAGLDMEMTSLSYTNHLKQLVEEGQLNETTIDSLVRNVLRIKIKMGLFENPFFVSKDSFPLLSKENLEIAKMAAVKSCVLLKNKNNILPLSPNQRIAIIGPMSNAPKEQLGTWIFDGDKSNSITPLMTFEKDYPHDKFLYTPGLTYSRDTLTDGFEDAMRIAKQSDVILFFGGEEAILSGEAHSRADIRLPGKQEALIQELAKTNKPIILVLLAGRPIALASILPKLSAVLVAWHPGTMGGPAIYDLLMGKENPSGKLPVTWPKSAGQIPIYYNHNNTGRPADSSTFVSIEKIPIEAWQSSLGNQSHYLDEGFTPQYPFGFGLTYAHFTISGFKLDKQNYSLQDTIYASVTISNTSLQAGTETIQVYSKDHVASLTRPVKELKSFYQLRLNPKESKNIVIKIPVSHLGFYSLQQKYIVEQGKFSLYIGSNADASTEAIFEVH